MAGGIATKFLQTVPLICDDQGRITLPVHIRNAMSELDTKSILVGRLTSDCLLGYNELAFDRIIAEANEIHFNYLQGTMTEEQRDAERRMRHMYGSFAMCAPDKQNRINVPQNLREEVGIYPGQKIIMVGLGDHLEIWSQEKHLADRKAHDEKSALKQGN